MSKVSRTSNLDDRIRSALHDLDERVAAAPPAPDRVQHRYLIPALAAVAVLAVLAGTLLLGGLPEKAAVAPSDDPTPVPSLVVPDQDGPSQTPEQAERDEVFPVVAELPLRQRIGTIIGTPMRAPEGVWVLSRPTIPAGLERFHGCLRAPDGPDYQICDTEEYTELLLLNAGASQIQHAFPQPGGGLQTEIGGADWFQVMDDAVYCGSESTQATPLATVCRVDRSTLEFEGLLLRCDPSDRENFCIGEPQEVASLLTQILAGEWYDGPKAGSAGIEVEEDGGLVLVDPEQETRVVLSTEPSFHASAVMRP
ncbi:hypothetical protein [Kineosporia babensis]|uniref:Uncharacterized protein n=1 Tax=Kineosporia babensis TaxID=499548 RepID=A0A9X1NAW8_9ACTN|nr:hypothetical protein [Kineosporia babensis]MCD5310350.1 hypothetical protein [Kineosporia babensis]